MSVHFSMCEREKLTHEKVVCSLFQFFMYVSRGGMERRLPQTYLRLLCDYDVEVNIGVNEVAILISSHCSLDAHQTVLLNEMKRRREMTAIQHQSTVNVRCDYDQHHSTYSVDLYIQCTHTCTVSCNHLTTTLKIGWEHAP